MALLFKSCFLLIYRADRARCLNFKCLVLAVCVRVSAIRKRVVNRDSSRAFDSVILDRVIECLVKSTI